jgi:hypothetical protein
MAIAPNTNPFVSGSILTAAQMTALPMGIYSYVEKTTATSGVTAETIIVTLPAFTAVADRYYRVTAVIGNVFSTANAGYTLRIRKGTTTAGTQLMANDLQVLTSATAQQCTMIWTGTLTAGSQQMVFTGESTLSANFFAAATQPVQFFIEDIGGA